MKEKYMILKSEVSKSFKSDFNSYCCSRNLNCATAGALIWMTCPQVQCTGKREGFTEEQSCTSISKSPCSQFTVKMKTLRWLRIYDHSLFKLTGSRGIFLNKGFFRKPLWWKRSTSAKAIERSHSSSSIPPYKAFKATHSSHCRRQNTSLISKRLQWNWNSSMNSYISKKLTLEMAFT